MDGEIKQLRTALNKLREQFVVQTAELQAATSALDVGKEFVLLKVKQASAAIVNLKDRADETEGVVDTLVVRVDAGSAALGQLSSAQAVMTSRVSGAQSSIQVLNTGGVQLRNRVSAAEVNIVALSAKSHAHG